MAQKTLLKSANTNLQKGSVVDAPLEKKYICKLQVMKNKVMDDYLPIIPKASRVIKKEKVLFHLELHATVTDKNTGKPVPGKTLQFKSSRGKMDKLTSAKSTDKEGNTIVILETREQGDLKLGVKSPDVKLEEFPVTIKEAWYEARFLLTYYVIYHENSSNFRGPMVNDLDGSIVPFGNKHKKDFLQQVRRQGSGRINMPGYSVIRYNRKNEPFEYDNIVIGCIGEELQSSHSIAVDRTVIPYRHNLVLYFPSKEELGKRRAEDTGGRIINHHIDLYFPTEEESETWVKKRGGKIKGAYVKYVGRN